PQTRQLRWSIDLLLSGRMISRGERHRSGHRREGAELLCAAAGRWRRLNGATRVSSFEGAKVQGDGAPTAGAGAPDLARAFEIQATRMGATAQRMPHSEVGQCLVQLLRGA